MYTRKTERHAIGSRSLVVVRAAPFALLEGSTLHARMLQTSKNEESLCE
jgi:hypothetical protein